MEKFLKKLLKRKDIFSKFLQFILQIIANIYNLIMVLRNIAFNNGYLTQYKSGVSVISLGNISTGGTGKTPATIWLAKKIEAMHLKDPIILSRGYGGDEAEIFKNRLPHIPHILNSNRVQGAKQAISQYGNNICILLDDGLQHRYLDRDLNIVLIDALDPFGGGYVLPRGFLRESPLALQRSNIIIITRSDMLSESEKINLENKIHNFTTSPIFHASHTPTHFIDWETKQSISLESQKNILAFCGLGNPNGFKATLENIGYKNFPFITFQDHHAYTNQDKERLLNISTMNHSDVWVTTEKDAVKLQPPFPKPIWVLEIEFKLLSQEDSFLNIIHNLLKKENEIF